MSLSGPGKPAVVLKFSPPPMPSLYQLPLPLTMSLWRNTWLPPEHSLKSMPCGPSGWPLDQLLVV
jgi:hypothetical protein